MKIFPIKKLICKGTETPSLRYLKLITIITNFRLYHNGSKFLPGLIV